MTKAELIRRIAKRSGVPDTETKIFFELFLQKAASILNRGEAVKLRGIGFFQLRQGIIKDAVNKEKGKLIYSDLMVYFPAQEENISTEENLIFNIPVPLEEEYSEVDSCFSLSFGKPVIPLEGVVESDYFIPPSGSEMKKLIETKVDKLLRESEVIDRYIKGNEVLIIEADSAAADQIEINWDEPAARKLQLGKDENKTPNEFDHLTWDFGEDLSKQIEEEAIIDSANISEQNLTAEILLDNEEIEWNFEPPETEDEKKAEAAPVAKAETNDALLSEHKNDAEEKQEDINKSTDDISGSDSNNFERVRSLTSELGDDDLKELRESKKNLTWNFEEPPELNSGNEETVIDENIVLHTEDKEIDSNTNGTNSAVEMGKNIPAAGEEKATDEKEPETKSEIKKTKTDRITSVKSRNYSYSKEKSPFVFILALLTIIAVGVILFFFLQKDKLNFPWFSSKNAVETTKSSTPTIVPRQYDVPVSYPYAKQTGKEQLHGGTEAKTPPQAKNNLSSLLKGGKKNAATTKKEFKAPTISAVPKNENTSKIKNNIYKSGNDYIVQVSAWQSEFVANKEAEKYNRKGLRGFVVKANIPGKGTWYRVRVGNFKSAQEAEDFYSKLK